MEAMSPARRRKRGRRRAGGDGPGAGTEPTLVAGAVDARLTPEVCDIEHWLHAAPQGSLRGLTRGHRRHTQVPPRMLAPGPLREACLQE
ncbi:MAG TPA: hypothetical protein VFX28_11175, partial [Methylomirabilota bacterium]|nr:hypothetical protein [Methylomirabilota bacterium]